MNIDPGAWIIIYCLKTHRFLLGKRSNQVHKPGYWNLFGGHIDPDESPHDAALRELMEETGLAPSGDQLFPLGDAGLQEIGYANGLREFHYFLLFADRELDPKLGPEHSQARWFPGDDLPQDLNRPTSVAIEIGMTEKARLLAEKMINGTFKEF